MKFWDKRLTRFAEGAFFLGVILTILSYGQNLYWAFDAITHLRPILSICFLLYVWIPLIQKKRIQIVLCLICFLLNFCPWVPFLIPASSARSSTKDRIHLRVLQSNLLTSNTHYQELIKLVDRTDPDILLLQETSQGWLDHLSVLHARYPIRVLLPRDDFYGIAAFAKSNIGNGKIITLGDPIKAPIAMLTLPYGKKTLTCFSIHATAPCNTFMWKSRNVFMKNLAELIAKTDPPVLVTGDFNNTPYSSFFRKFVQDATLCDTTRSFGLHPTWPSFLPFFFRIQLDHCLHSPDITIDQKKNESPIGSDHLPVTIDISFPSE